MLNKIKNFFKSIFSLDTHFWVKEDVKSKLTSADIKALEKKTKNEIEKIGRKIGVELDKRLTKAKMIAQVKKANK